MTHPLGETTRHNVAALYSLSELIHGRGYWISSRDVHEDVAITLYELFQIITWSDRDLNGRECELFETVTEVDRFYGGNLEQIVAGRGQWATDAPTQSGCLAAMALHDANHGTKFADMFMHHLENLAILVMMSDARIRAEETAAFERYRSFLVQAVYQAPSQQT